MQRKKHLQSITAQASGPAKENKKCLSLASDIAEFPIFIRGEIVSMTFAWTMAGCFLVGCERTGAKPAIGGGSQTLESEWSEMLICFDGCGLGCLCFGLCFAKRSVEEGAFYYHLNYPTEVEDYKS